MFQQLHVEVKEIVEGGDDMQGPSLQVAIICIGKYLCMGVELLGLLNWHLNGQAEHQHATQATLLYRALRQQGLAPFRNATHEKARVLLVGSLDGK
jgi:hypothetical protein